MFRRSRNAAPEAMPPVETETPAGAQQDFAPDAVRTLRQNAAGLLHDMYQTVVPLEALPVFASRAKGSVLVRIADDNDPEMAKNPYVSGLRRDFDELYKRGAFTGSLQAGLPVSEARVLALNDIDRVAHREALLERLKHELRKPEKDFNEKIFIEAVRHLPEHKKLPPSEAAKKAEALAGNFANSVIVGERAKMRGYDEVSRFVGLPQALDARMVTLLSRCLAQLASNPKKPVSPDPIDVTHLMQTTLAISQEIVAHNRQNPHNQKGFESVSATVNHLVAAAERMLNAPSFPANYRHSAAQVLQACGRTYVEPQKDGSRRSDSPAQTPESAPKKSPIVDVRMPGAEKKQPKITDPTYIPGQESGGRVTTVDVGEWLRTHKGPVRTAATAAVAGAIIVTNASGAAAMPSSPRPVAESSRTTAQPADVQAGFGGIIVVSTGLGGSVSGAQAAPAAPPAASEVRFSTAAPRVFSSGEALGAVAVGPTLDGQAPSQPEVGSGQSIVTPKKVTLPPAQETILKDAVKHAEVLTKSTLELADSLLRGFQGVTGATLKDPNRVTNMFLGVADTVSKKDGDFTTTAKNYIAHAVVASQLPDVFDNSQTKEVYNILLSSLPEGIAPADKKYILQFVEDGMEKFLKTEQFSAGKNLYSEEQLQKLAKLVALSDVHNLNAQELADIIAQAKAAEAAQQPVAPVPVQTETPNAPEQPAPGEQKPVSPGAEKPIDPEAQLAALKNALAEFKVPQEYIDLFIASANKYGIPVSITVSDAQAESNFKKDAVGPMTKSGEAKGIAQFIDATWGQIVKDLNFPSDASPFDVKYAIPAQAYYLSQQFKNAQSALAAGKVQGDPYELMLAGYNAGFGNVLKYKGIPPFEETQKYVRKIMANKAKIEAMVAGQAVVQPKAEKPAAPEGAEGEWHGTIVPVYENGKVVGMKKGSETVPDKWKGHTYLNQHDERWAESAYQRPDQSGRTITSSGCGPTSQAMVYSNLLGRFISPVEVGELNVKKGFRADEGTSHGAFAAIAEHFGLKAKNINPDSLEEIKKVTDAGGYVITNGTDTDPATPGTKGGHIFVIRGVTAEGKILVLDPNSFAKTMVAYDPQSDIFDANSVAVAIFK
ncbi:C39 family peptidase [Candidatus Saccharibacteria bacterium]|nr:MAG: C39 family peptidase [Candidatus Saccharibacteria bacterium]